MAVTAEGAQGFADVAKALVERKAVEDVKLTGEVKASKEAADKLTKEKTSLETALAETNAKLAAIEAEKVKAARIATIVKEVGADEVVAAALYETVAEVNDEKFANFVAKCPKVVAAVVKNETETETKVDKTKEELAALEAAKAEKFVGATEGEQDSKLKLAVASITSHYENKRTNKNQKVTK